MSGISKQSELIFLELGQIIQINATENLKIHEKIFIIDYLDNEKIDLIQQDDLSSITLNILDGNITDESIESIFEELPRSLSVKITEDIIREVARKIHGYRFT